MENQARVRRRFTIAEKVALVVAFRRSGLSQQRFAVKQGIAPSNIQRWVRQREGADQRAGPAALVEVPNPLASRPGGGAYRLHFSQGLQLEVARGFDLGEVRTLAQLLQNL